MAGKREGEREQPRIVHLRVGELWSAASSDNYISD